MTSWIFNFVSTRSHIGRQRFNYTELSICVTALWYLVSSLFIVLFLALSSFVNVDFNFRILWGFMTVGMISFFGFCAYGLVKDFVDVKLITKVTVERAHELQVSEHVMSQDMMSQDVMSEVMMSKIITDMICRYMQAYSYLTNYKRDRERLTLKRAEYIFNYIRCLSSS